jgi:hypothetical protein
MREYMKYEWSDVWLLQTIICGGGNEGASLYHIISTGDALNHAIFTDEELESGFARLTEGGLIEERDERFFGTPEAKEMYSKASSRSGSIFTIRDRLSKALGATPWQPNKQKPEQPLKYPGFSPKEVAKAINQYQKDARKMMRKNDPTSA